jgi:hypothetical protein
MYTLDCKHYTKSFSTLDELISDMRKSGISPVHHVVINNKSTFETVLELKGI